jgi:release factor glutamine methyltransferase
MSESAGGDHLISGSAKFDLLVGAFSAGWPSLPDKPEETPAASIRALWFAALGQPRSLQNLPGGDLPALGPEAESRLQQLIERRLSGVPLAHLVGRQGFMGLEFIAGPQALIPRKETEILGRVALNCVREIQLARGPARVIDLCTGSGNLAIALAVHEPACRVFASDLCAEAVALAQENARLHRVQDRVEFRVGDLFAPFADGEFDASADLIVCNPPYLSSSKVGALPREIGEFEPRAAFEGGGFGLTIISRLINEAPRYLKPGSWLCFEVGLGQGTYLASHLKRLGTYRTVEPARDESGEIRALLAAT